MRAGSQSLTTALSGRACYRLDPASEGPEGSSAGCHAFEGEFIGLGSGSEGGVSGPDSPSDASELVGKSDSGAVVTAAVSHRVCPATEPIWLR